MLAMTVSLLCVLMLDGRHEFVEQLDQLCGGLVGEARKSKWQDDGAAFHWTSSRAFWTCSEEICLSLARAAAESA